MSEFKRGDRVRIVWPDAASKNIREKLDGQTATVIRESGSQQVEVELDPGFTWALSDVYIPSRFLELFPSVNGAFRERAEELSSFRHFLIQGGFSPNEAYTLILEAMRNR